MPQLSPRKRKKRQTQLREAQRRRRARLKEESKCFLQVILDEETLSQLRQYSRSIQQSVQTCAAEIIQRALQDGPVSREAGHPPFVPELISSKDSGSDQLDLFVR